MAEDFVKVSIRTRSDFALLGISDEAELLFRRGLEHCALIGQPGILPSADVRGLLPKRAKESVVVAELLAADLWQSAPNAFIYRSWDKWQGALNQVEAKRTKDAKRKREDRAAYRAIQLGLIEDAS